MSASGNHCIITTFTTSLGEIAGDWDGPVGKILVV